MVLVWGTPDLPVPCTACLASVSQGTDWSSRQGSAGSHLQHPGEDREHTIVKARLFLGLDTPLFAAFPSESCFLWHIFVLISCVSFLRKNIYSFHSVRDIVGRTRVWALAYDWQVQIMTSGCSWLLHVLSTTCCCWSLGTAYSASLLACFVRNTYL